jgi:hypothetical protein
VKKLHSQLGSAKRSVPAVTGVALAIGNVNHTAPEPITHPLEFIKASQRGIIR